MLRFFEVFIPVKLKFGRFLNLIQEQIVITSSQVRIIRWMHKSLLIKLPDILTSPFHNVWATLILMELNSSPSGQNWLLLGDFFILTVQLLTA